MNHPDPPHSPSPPPEHPPRRVGFVGLAGVPNVDKSTLVNRLVGAKVSIVSDRPQTTRERVCGIYTDDRMQAVLVDVPGILEPADAFNEHLVEWAAFGLRHCDLILHLRDARRPPRGAVTPPEEEPVLAMLRRTNRPVWVVWNKIDRVPGNFFPAEAPDFNYQRAFGIAARTGRGLPLLLDAIADALPEGPLLYEPDQVSDRDLRFMASEMVREKLFRYLGQEIAYATATQTEIFDENRPGKPLIRVLIITEREAHKSIIIGKGGAMLKKIGENARKDIERLYGQPVFLQLWVKVRPKWRRSEAQLGQLGLKPPRG